MRRIIDVHHPHLDAKLLDQVLISIAWECPELHACRTTIIETKEEIAAKHRPVVLITSNNEKELPDAFLHLRCRAATTRNEREVHHHRA